MTELIVALDNDAADAGAVFLRLYRNTSIRWFKIGPQLLLQHSGMILLENMMEGYRRPGTMLEVRDDVNLFFDLKCYDTRDTVYNIARRAFDLGARFITVHATPSMLEAAMRAKPPGDCCKVLAVGPLTDGANPRMEPWVGTADGIICSVEYAKMHRREYRGVFVCPGIRRGPPPGRPNAILGGYETPDNHVNPATPAEAKAAGADFVVVGRPIYEAPDPVVAARAILEELR